MMIPAQMRREARKMMNFYMGVDVRPSKIRLLEAHEENGKLTELFFQVSGKPVSYYYSNTLYTRFCVYPTEEGKNGCIVSRDDYTKGE